jgi:hypothetical protein
VRMYRLRLYGIRRRYSVIDSIYSGSSISRRVEKNNAIRWMYGDSKELIKSKDFARRVCAPFRGGEGLDNILLNPRDGDTFTHVEVERDDVRLEFRNPWDPTYQHFAALFVSRGHEEYEKVLESCPETVRALAPAIKDVRNNISCGAGATVYVSPRKYLS